MNRWERECFDAELDDAARVMVGTPCPVCGDATKEGSGPCSDACAVAMERAERRADIGDDWSEDAALDERDEEPAPSWMFTEVG